ncbi:uncharacterized protein LOC131000191 [Salvia miltiorrhiza]|uniref:uncharacterized protein LOC131000191 n=1 Tax=Salvia miltiorrhiza TaxID=226208 RepID=UPI0025AC4E1D|nr:uncharacterized protein LOC131000191 [Salvia miltiorrhiza]
MSGNSERLREAPVRDIDVHRREGADLSLFTTNLCSASVVATHALPKVPTPSNSIEAKLASLTSKSGRNSESRSRLGCDLDELRRHEMSKVRSPKEEVRESARAPGRLMTEFPYLLFLDSSSHQPLPVIIDCRYFPINFSSDKTVDGLKLQGGGAAISDG